MAEITLLIAFVAGLLSFLSPCVLPLVPGFLAYLSGVGIGQGRFKTFANSVAYVLGFSSVFSLLGVLLNTVLQGVAYTVQIWLSRIGGLIIIGFGLFMTGLIKIPWLEKEHTITKKSRWSNSYLTSFMFGASFAVGWTPCVGAVLGTVLALAVSSPAIATGLLLSYSLGLGVPFLLVGLFTAQASAFIRKYAGFLKYFNIVVGILVIILGVLVFTQTLNLIANFDFINEVIL